MSIKKNISHFIYVFIILIFIIYIILVSSNYLLAYIYYKSDNKYSILLKKKIVLMNPNNKKQIGIAKKGLYLEPPSYSDAIDLGVPMTFKIVIDLQENDIEEIDYNSEKFFSEIHFK